MVYRDILGYIDLYGVIKGDTWMYRGICRNTQGVRRF